MLTKKKKKHIAKYYTIKIYLSITNLALLGEKAIRNLVSFFLKDKKNF